MKEELEKAIKVLAEKINRGGSADEALKCMQAAFEAARVIVFLKLND